MTKWIFFLVKFFGDEAYVNNFVSGKIFSNRLSYFKRTEENGEFTRSDKHEGVIGWFQPDRRRIVLNGIDLTPDLAGPVEIQRSWLENINVFCMYAAHNRDLDLGSVSSENIGVIRNYLKIDKDNFKFGEFAVVVKNVKEFINRIENAAKAKNYQIGRGLVKYYDPDIFSDFFSDGEAVFRKRDTYRHQQEYRFVIDSRTEGLNAITLDIGDISDITIRMKAVDINSELLGGKISLTP